MSKKILVGYSTWSGVTHEVADEIAKVLQEQGLTVETVNLKKKTAELNYDGYVLGTSIHASKPIGSFTKFLKRNQPILAKKPTAYFLVCANMYEDTPENREESLGWLQSALKDIPEIPVIDTGLFGGAVMTSGPDYENLNFFLKGVIRTMEKSITEKLGKDDFRDWEKIHAWAKVIAKKL